MDTQKNFWQRIGVQDWFLKNPETRQPETPLLTPEEVYRYIVQKFGESVKQLSFADRIVFFHEYIICFNEEDYRQFMSNKAGLFGLIAHEAVKEFGNVLERYRNPGTTGVP